MTILPRGRIVTVLKVGRIVTVLIFNILTKLLLKLASKGSFDIESSHF